MLEAGTSAAVLGSSGFIGGAVAGALERRGIECARFTRDRPFLVGTELAPPLRTANVLFWLISSIRPATTDAAAKAAADLNALERLLARLAERPGPPPRILAVSSGGTVYDNERPPPYSERSPVRAANSYGAAMLEVEQLLREQAPDQVILRASNAYGPGQPARRGQGVVAHWLDSIRREEPIRVLGDPATSRDYIYIDDLVEALLLSAALPQPPPVLNVGSGEPTSLAELIELMARAVGHPLEVEYSPARSFDAPSTWLDVSLAATALGFKPAVGIAEGVHRAWRSVARLPPT